MLDSKIAQNFHALYKANPKISGNIKIVIDDDSTFIESIDSNAELSSSLYKAYKVNDTSNLMVNVKNFAKLFVNKSDIFAVKTDMNDATSNFGDQHQQLYTSGAYSDTSELFAKRFRYFAPLYMNENGKVPDLFVVYVVDKLDPNKTKKLAYVNDLRTSNIGDHLRRHRTYMQNYKNFDFGLYVNFTNHVALTGTSLDSGLVETRYIDDTIALQSNERTIAEFNNYITNLHRDNLIIDSRFLNLEFCFDIDMSDIELNDKFLDVVGFYCDLDEFTSLSAYNISDAAFKLIEDNSKFTRVDKPVIELSDLKDNLVKVNTAFAVELTSIEKPSIYAPLIMMQLMSIPNAGDTIELTYNNTIAVKYEIKQDDIILNDVLKTAKNIAREFNLVATSKISDIYVNAFIHDEKYFVIRSLINDKSYDDIQVSKKPIQMKVIQPEFIVGTYENKFYSPSDASVLTKGIIGMSAQNVDSLSVNNTRSKIVFAAKWLDMYFYNLENSISSVSTARYIDLIRTEKSKMHALSIVEKRAFDFDKTNSYHTDVFDFELVAYKKWLLSEIAKPDFLGKYLSMPPANTMAEYKSILIQIVNRYFDAIDISRNMLLKDMNTIDFDATSTKNEFDRLAENDNASLIKTNMINQYVCKYMYANGLDVYNRPYTLNIAVPFRYDNFAPSLDSSSRDLRFSTHSWPIIGEGMPPYFNLISAFGKQIVKEENIELDYDVILRDIGDFSDPSSQPDAYNGIAFSVDDNKLIVNGTTDGAYFDFIITSQIMNSLAETVKLNAELRLLNAEISNTVIAVQLVHKTPNGDILIQTIPTSVLLQPNVSQTIDVSATVNSSAIFAFDASTDEIVVRVRYSSGWTSTVVLNYIRLVQTTDTITTVDDSLLFTEEGVDDVVKHFEDMIAGYTSKRISKADIESSTVDVYNFIKSHSVLAIEDRKSTCFFRGLKIAIDDEKYDGWKFSSILITSTAPLKSDRSIEMIENTKFKTITLVITMYIPEPVLTGLEIPGKYFLDRSLLYFSDGNYASEVSLSSFGEAEISLIMHNTSNQKYLLDAPVTTDWYYQTGGQNFIHVERGNESRFNINFNNIMNVGSDFKTFFGNVNDVETEMFGIEITFKNVQEVKEKYFWCEEIHVRLKETVDDITTVIEFNMLEEFLTDQNSFLTKNRFDIIEAILFENAKYYKVLKNVSAISRFSLLSAASIFDNIRSFNLPVYRTDGAPNLYVDVDAYSPTPLTVAVKLREENKSIVNIKEQYTMSMVRQNGQYIPTTIQIQPPSKNKLYTISKYDVIQNAYKVSRNIPKQVEKFDTDKQNNLVWFYPTSLNKTGFNNLYKHYLNTADSIELPWWICPSEFRLTNSIILSSISNIDLDGKIITDDAGYATIDIFDYVKPYLVRLLNNSGYVEYIAGLTEQDKINIVRTNVDNPSSVNASTIHLYDVDDIIIRRFYASCFSKIYSPKQLLVNGEKIDYFELTNDVIKTVTKVTNDSDFVLTITRI